jgi:hypothetical protein
MSALRWLGLIVGLATTLYVFQLFRHARCRKSNFLLGMLFGLGLLAASVNPKSVNLLRDMLALESAQLGRLIALLIVSNVLVWLLLLYSRFRIEERAHQFDRLVRQLGVSEFERLYPQFKSFPSIAVVIPAYNEEENIGHVLGSAPKEIMGKELSVVVIDDGSSDRTFEVAREAGALAVRSPINRGGGAALRMGFDIARKHGAEIVVTMDADGQHLPSEIERLLTPILSDEMDFVIGSRLLGQREKDSFVRLAGIHVFNTVIRLLTPVKITDCSNGFRAFRTSELTRVLLRQDQFHTSELIIDAAKKGIRIGEAPITVKRRLSGESKKGKNWTYGLAFARTVFKTWWR